MAEPELSDIEQAVALMRQAALNERWNALTRFEQDVGSALNGHLIHGSSVADCPISAHWLTFAPRVAAAIVAGAKCAAAIIADAPPGDTSWYGKPEAAALAALRDADA